MPLFYLLVGLMPLEHNPLLGTHLGAVTTTKYLGLVCLLWALVKGLRDSSALPRLRQPFAWCLYGLTAWAALSYGLMSRIQRPLLASPAASYFSFLLLLPTVVILVDSIPRLRNTLTAMVAGLAVTSLYLIREWVTHRNVPGFRPGWVAGDPNYFSVAAVLALPVGLLLWRHWPSRAIRWLWGLALLVIFVADGLAASRGGFLGLLGAGLFLIWRRPEYRKPALAGLLLLVPLILVLPQSPLRRFQHPTRGDREAVTTREKVWRAGWRMIQRNPILGVGLGNYKYVVQRYEAANRPLPGIWMPGEGPELIAHNTYIELAAELGLPGFIAWFCLWIGAWRGLSWSRRQMQGQPQSMIRVFVDGGQSGLVGYALSMTFLSAEYQKLLWLVLILGFALPALVRQRAARPVAQSMPAAA